MVSSHNNLKDKLRFILIFKNKFSKFGITQQNLIKLIDDLNELNFKDR
jgi:hypothetical protein